jgi:hypothetical protein
MIERPAIAHRKVPVRLPFRLSRKSSLYRPIFLWQDELIVTLNLIPSILLQLNINLSRLSNRLDPRRARPVLRQSLERPQLTVNNLLSRKVPFSLRQLLKIHLLAASYFHWADLSRKCKTKPVINPHCHYKTHHPPSLIEVLRTLRDPRRMVSADQSWYSLHCSRYPKL